MGGRSKLAVDKRDTTRLAVYKGTSNLAAKSQKVEVRAGFGSKAEKGKAPTTPKPLPAAPGWNNPPQPVILTLQPTTDLEVQLSPGKSKGAAVDQWHWQLSKGASFEDLVMDIRVPAQVSSLSARQLPAGNYFVRVSGIDADSFEGPFGAAATFSVIPLSLTGEEGSQRVKAAQGGNVRCGFGSAELKPLPPEGLAIPSGPQTLRCALAQTPAQVGTLQLGKPPVVIRGIQVTLEQAEDDGEFRAHVVTRGPDGKAVSPKGLELKVRTPDGKVRLLKFEADEDNPGHYTADLKAEPGAKPFQLVAVIDGKEHSVSHHAKVAFASVGSKRPRPWELDALLGAKLENASDHADTYATYGLRAGYSLSPTKRFTLVPGLRLGYEHNSESGLPGAGHGEHALTASAELRGRVKVAPMLHAYAGVSPGVVRSAYRDASGTRIADTAASIGGAGGFELRAKTMKISLEGGYRHTFSDKPGSSSFRGAQVTLGVGALF